MVKKNKQKQIVECDTTSFRLMNESARNRANGKMNVHLYSQRLFWQPVYNWKVWRGKKYCRPVLVVFMYICLPREVKNK